MQRLKLHYTTLTNYDQTFTDINVIFNKENIQNTLGEVLASNNKTQIRIAETEKYPHVTFFFSGGREAVFEGEQRLMVPSPKVPTYDLQPEMSAVQVTETIVAEIKKAQTDFICLNFANPDMVGHTGDYNAILKALATVDRCSQEVAQAGLEKDYAILIIADHGNADFALNKDGSPNTAHSTNMVPFFALNTGCKQLNNGKLADIAPTILQLMGIEIPQEMTGKILTS
jgi:2,3-bisphosphoglycerate-independent phosphoglycerate mutase